MVYHGTSMSESILFHPIGNHNQVHFVEITKAATKPTFFVTCCCDEEWFYEFYMDNNSDYERVKMAIMEAIVDCDSVYDLMDELSEIFEDGFTDILVEDDCDDDCGCDGDCENCEMGKY